MPGHDGAINLPAATQALNRLDDLPLDEASDNGKHQCSRCPAKFKRVEHLKRHQLGHQEQRRFVCPVCSKRFTRSDTLNRHVSVHRAQDSRGAGAKRACFECARVRERCTKATPCQRCHSKSIECIYPLERSRHNRSVRKSVAPGPAKTSMQHPTQNTRDRSSEDGSWTKETSDGCDIATETPQGPSSANLEPSWPSFPSESGGLDPARRIGTDAATHFPRFTDGVRTKSTTPGAMMDNRVCPNPSHQFPDSNLRGAGVSSPPLAPGFPYTDSDCPMPTMNAAPPLGSTLATSPQLNSVTLGYNPDGYDATFEFPLNWLPANESPDLDYSSIPRFGFNSPLLFEEPSRLRITGDSSMAVHTDELGQPNTHIDIQMRDDFSNQTQHVNQAHQITINNPSSMAPSARSPQFTTQDNGWQSDDRSEVSNLTTSTPSPSVTISATAQGSKKQGLISSAIGGLYATSTNGARLPCTAREKRPSMVIFGATALPAVSQDIPLLDHESTTIAFPPLEHITYKSLSPGIQSGSLRDETYQLIITRFRQLCLDCGNIYSTYSNSGFPSIAHLNFFIQLFFQHVNPILPIYNNMLTDFNDHWILALAICAMGCQYTETVEFSRCVLPLHEFLCRGLDMELQGQDLTRLELPLIQAMILNQLTMLYYGPRGLSQKARTRNGTLVELVQTMSLLSPSRMGKDNFRSDDLSLETQWKQWLDEEARRRLGYTIWLLDNMAVYHHGRRPLLSLECAQSSLPNDRLWGAQSAQAWHDLFLECKENPSLPTAVQDIFRQKAVKSDLGEYSRVILLHGVYHEVLRVKEYFNRPLSAWIPSAQKVDQEHADGGAVSRAPGPDNRNALSRWRNAALDCVDVLHWDANGTIAQLAGAEHSTVFHLHLSRVVLLAPYEQIRTLTLSIASMIKRQPHGQIPTRTEALEAEREVLEWAQRDEHKARLTMIHCGCLFWHMRRYSRKAFYEPASILLATLVIWAYSCYTGREQGPNLRQKRRSQNRQLHPSGPSREQSIGIDVTANTSPESTSTTSQLTISTVAEAAAAMSESSYPIPTSIQIDRPCDDEMVQLFVRSGRPSVMRAYITGVGDILGPKAPGAILSEGKKILCAVSAAWGRTTESVALLEALEEAMAERVDERCQTFADGSR
ncbi:hypothetical protein BGZ63DRAFT_254791 [Mariannaea sp. PMI_226]|nr:hypothetical protein BGZ63DRAFT_254791 [Mariannaea sp. PMI_226]